MPAPDSIIEIAAHLQVDAGNLHHVARMVDKSMGAGIAKGVDHGMKEGQKIIQRGLERAASASDFAKKMFEARETRKQLVGFAGKIGDWFSSGYTKAQKAFFEEIDKYHKRRRRREQDHEDLMHERRKQAASEIENFRRKELDEQIDTYGRGMAGVLENLKTGELAGIAGLVSAAGRGGVTRGRAWQAAGEADDAGRLQKAVGKLGTGMVALGKSIAVVGATAGVFAVVVKLLMDILDVVSAAKKAYLEMGGAVAMGTSNVEKMHEQMQEFYDELVYKFDFKYEWSLTKDEVLGMVAALGEGGANMARLRAETKAGTSVLKTLKDNIGFAVTYATMFGKKIGEVGTDMASLSFELGVSMETIYRGFASVAEITKIAGFNAKRFYGTVLEVTSGMGIYSRRVEEAAGMLRTLSNVLGETVGAEFLKGIKTSFKDMPMTERIQIVTLAGTENVQRIMQDAADRQAKAVEDNLGTMARDGDKRARAIIKAFGGSADKVADTIAQMGQEEYRRAEARAIRAGGPGTAEQLRMLTRLRRLQQGAVDPRMTAGALQDLGPMHDALVRLLSAFRPLPGGFEANLDKLDDLGSIVTGMSQEQIHQMQDFIGRNRGGWELLQESSGKTREELARHYGLIERQGQFYEKGTDRVISNLEDFLLAASHIQEDTKAQKDLMTDQAKAAKDIRGTTEATSKQLENLKDEYVQRYSKLWQDLIKRLPKLTMDIVEAINSLEAAVKEIAPAIKGLVKYIPGVELPGEAMEKFRESAQLAAEQLADPRRFGPGTGWIPGTEKSREEILGGLTGEAMWERVKGRAKDLKPGEVEVYRKEAISQANKLKEDLLKENPGMSPSLLGSSMANLMSQILGDPGVAYGPDFVGPVKPAGDFVVTDRGEVIKADPRDTIVGFRPGTGVGGPGGGAVYVNIYGGNQREVYATVRKALQVSRVATA